jgi:hypothetical protein
MRAAPPPFRAAGRRIMSAARRRDMTLAVKEGRVAYLDPWAPPPVPDDPRELRRIRNQLIILAVIGAVAIAVSMITG